jgi:putative transposase
MIDRKSCLPLKRQCQLLKLARSSLYYRARPVSEGDLRLMRRLDELHLEHPFAGARMLRDFLSQEALKVGRRRVGRLMRLLGIQALYRRPGTTRRAGGQAVYPYLLRGLTIERSNQVWAADITYIPMRRGFVYLFAVMDWASRRVLAWRLSNTLSTEFCLEAVREAIGKNGCPEIFNTDQGCQFTSQEFVALLTEHGIRISMDGKGAWRDNVFVERLWRTIKYEEVYLKAYEDVTAARRSLEKYLGFYNARRPHQALDGKTPEQIYWSPQAAGRQAA